MAGGINRPPNKQIVDPQTGRLTLEWDAFFATLERALNAVSQGSLVATQSYTVATLPSPVTAGAGRVLYVSDAAGGAIPAFSDGTNWRRVDTRAIVT